MRRDTRHVTRLVVKEKRGMHFVEIFASTIPATLLPIFAATSDRHRPGIALGRFTLTTSDKLLVTHLPLGPPSPPDATRSRGSSSHSMEFRHPNPSRACDHRPCAGPSPQPRLEPSTR